jgi:uncharacterized protein (DUF1697 family)
MPTYISILRGINVGGHKKIKMVDLKNLYESIGFTNVRTYIQSGNIVFEYKETDVEILQQLIFNKIKSHYGFEVPNLILNSKDIELALKNNPYTNIEKVFFIFLSATPEQLNIDELYKYEYDGEYYSLKGKVIYYYCTGEYSKAKMGNNFFEKKLKVSATSRNLNTTQKLLEMTTFISN